MKLLSIQVKNRKKKSSRNKGRGSKQQFQINSEISFDVLIDMRNTVIVTT